MAIQVVGGYERGDEFDYVVTIVASNGERRVEVWGWTRVDALLKRLFPMSYAMRRQGLLADGVVQGMVGGVDYSIVIKS